MSGQTLPTRALTTAVLVLSVSALGGCGVVADILSVQRPTASIVGVRLADIGLQAATMVFDVEVTNPYSVPLPLVNLDYGVASEGASFLSGKAAMQGAVPAGGSKTVSLPAKVVYLELLKVLKGVKPGSVVPYTATLGLSVDAPAVGPLRLPLSKSGRLPVPAAPEVKVSEIRWDKLTLDAAGGRVKLDMVNRNQFPVEMTALRYALSLGGIDVATSSMVKGVAFGADGGAGTIEIPIAFSPRKLGLAAFGMLTGSGSGYKLHGDLIAKTPFGPMSLPIDGAGNAVFKR